MCKLEILSTTIRRNNVKKIMSIVSLAALTGFSSPLFANYERGHGYEDRGGWDYPGYDNDRDRYGRGGRSGYFSARCVAVKIRNGRAKRRFVATANGRRYIPAERRACRKALRKCENSIGHRGDYGRGYDDGYGRGYARRAYCKVLRN
jgi:hypothetical protein